MKKAYICPEGHSLLVDEAVSMNGHCSACHTDYPLYLLTLDKKKKEDKVFEKKDTPAAKPKAATKPKTTANSKPSVKATTPATKPAIASGEKTVEIPATTSSTKPETKKPATKKPTAKKTAKKKKK